MPPGATREEKQKARRNEWPGILMSDTVDSIARGGHFVLQIQRPVDGGSVGKLLPSDRFKAFDSFADGEDH